MVLSIEETCCQVCLPPLDRWLSGFHRHPAAAQRLRLSRRGPTVAFHVPPEPLAGRGQAGGDG